MYVLDFVAKSGHQSDKSVLSLMNVFYCVCVRLCYCGHLLGTADVSSFEFLFSVTHLCETMISPSSR